MLAPDPSSPPPASAEDGACLPIPSRLAEFELQRVLGIGGFGIVYLAHDTSLGRRVAIKEYMPAALASRRGRTEVVVRSERHRETFDAGLKSFVNEARLLAQFDHPALVKVFRFWEDHGTAYMVMPFIEGITLKDRLRALAAPPDEEWLRALLAPLTEALQVLHARQCYHRDIAPDNIILLADSGRPLLLDFGAARRVIGDMTQALTVILKPGYAPLEQYAEVPHMRQGPWTDVYALAAVVYHAISGRTPPVAVARVLSDTCAPLAELAAGRYGADFLQAIDRALAVRPEDRTPDIAQLRAELGLQTRAITDDDATLRLVSDAESPSAGSPSAAVDPRAVPSAEPFQAGPAADTPPTGFAPTMVAAIAGAENADRTRARSGPPATSASTAPAAEAQDISVTVVAPTAFAPTSLQPRPSGDEATVARSAPPSVGAAGGMAEPTQARAVPNDVPRSAVTGTPADTFTGGPSSTATRARTGLWLGIALLLAAAGGAALLATRREEAATPPPPAPPTAVAVTGAAGTSGATGTRTAAPTVDTTASAAPRPAAATGGDNSAATAPFDPARAFEQVLAGAGAGWDLQLTPPPRALSIARRDRLRFTLRSARDGYFHVLMRDADGSLALVLPNSRARDHRIRAGQSLQLPPTGSPLEASEPVGAADILVVVSARPRDFEALGGRRVSSFWLLPDATTLGRLDAREAPKRHGPLLSAPPIDCADTACADYGAARFTLQVIR